MVTSLATKEDYLKAIGLITAEWNALESSMAWVFSQLSGCDMDKGRAIFYAIHSNQSRRHMTEAVAQIALKKHPRLLKQLGMLLHETSKAAKKRNAYAHALWGVSPDGTLVTTGNFVERTTVTVGELTAASDQMAKLQSSYVQLISQLSRL